MKLGPMRDGMMRWMKGGLLGAVVLLAGCAQPLERMLVRQDQAEERYQSGVYSPDAWSSMLLLFARGRWELWGGKLMTPGKIGQGTYRKKGDRLVLSGKGAPEEPLIMAEREGGDKILGTPRAVADLRRNPRERGAWERIWFLVEKEKIVRYPRSAILEEILPRHFVVVRKIGKLPAPIREELRKGGYRMADPGEPFDATDVVMGHSNRRLILAGSSPGLDFVCYEHGGLGYHLHFLVFKDEGGGTRRVYEGVILVGRDEAWSVKKIKSLIEDWQVKDVTVEYGKYPGF